MPRIKILAKPPFSVGVPDCLLLMPHLLCLPLHYLYHYIIITEKSASTFPRIPVQDVSGVDSVNSVES